MPQSIVSDQNGRFMSQIWKELFKLKGLDLNFSISMHSQTDGQIVRVNVLLETYL